MNQFHGMKPNKFGQDWLENPDVILCAFVRMYMCICVRACVYVIACVFVGICACWYMCLYVHMCVCACVYVCAYGVCMCTRAKFYA